MDLTGQTVLLMGLSVDTDTNILTIEIRDSTTALLGTIEIENSKFNALTKSLSVIAKDRITNTQFKGGWHAGVNEPPLADSGMTTPPVAGDSYYVISEGTQNLGSGSQTFYVGNFVYYTGAVWKRTYTDSGNVDSKTALDIQSNIAEIVFI